MADAPDTKRSFVEKIGIPGALFWAFVGQLLFMVGDGVEAGYLDTFMLHTGHPQSFVNELFTFYGITVMIAAWFAGPLSDLMGPKKVMWMGLILWAVLEVGFLVFGLTPNNSTWILTFYALRGFAYPLFAYGFLVWIAAATPTSMLGAAAGWFWFSFSAGLPTLGSQFARFAIPAIGEINTFWCSLGLVVIGGLIALLFTREPTGNKRLLPADVSARQIFLGSISIIWREPKTLIAGIVRTIDTSSEYAFLAIMPGFFVDHLGFTLGQWLNLLSLIFLSNIIVNLISGMIADRIGYRFVVAAFGGVGGFITIPLFYYVPLWYPGNFAAAAVVGILYGASVAAFVPLSGLMPQICPREKAAALSILGLGAGASTWVGPAIVSLCGMIFGVGMAYVIWAFAIIYLLSAGLTMMLSVSPEARRYTAEQEKKSAAS